MANAINAFLEDYGPNQIIQTSYQDEKEKDASYQLPHHGFERSSNRNGHLKRNTLAKHWVRLILYRHHT